MSDNLRCECINCLIDMNRTPIDRGKGEGFVDDMKDSNGVKYDDGKILPSLLINDMPRAVTAVSEVLTFGAKKYSKSNWLKVENGIERYRNAGDRHRIAGAIDEIDEESGLLHLAHEAVNVLMVLELKLREKEGKNASSKD